MADDIPTGKIDDMTDVFLKAVAKAKGATIEMELTGEMARDVDRNVQAGVKATIPPGATEASFTLAKAVDRSTEMTWRLAMRSP